MKKKYAGGVKIRGNGALYNSEGYRDVTAFLALRNVEMEDRLRERFLQRALGKDKAEKEARREAHLRQLAEIRCRNEDEMFAWEELANAIILQAVEDWREAMRVLRKAPHDGDAMLTVKETEAFFLSRWFSCLTRVSGAMILNRLKEEFSA